jgi:hypothetical protein
MHPYQELCHLLREYQLACDAMDDDGALKIAMQVREAAQQFVVQAAKNVSPPADPRQLELDL